MPAARPRMHVTPTETSYRLLSEMAKLSGMGIATVVREVLNDANPEFELFIEQMRAVKKRPEQVQAAMNRYSVRAINELTQQMLDLDTAMQKKPGPKPKPKGRGAANTG